MKIGFYPKLAADSIRKNKKMFTPFILTCVGMVMMFYIIMYLAVNDVFDGMVGGETMRQIIALGSWVIAIFACIFLFYTNSFLIRRRKKEFGLYNILGMGKGSIGRILFWETLMVAVLSISIGLFAGISFSKLAELGLVNIMHGEITYDLDVSQLAIVRTLEVFGVIFLLLLIDSIRKVRFSSAIALLRGENTGEKPPRANWLLGIAGTVILIAAYYIAVTIKDPITALALFFVAVVMVIVGTYMIMIAGSVVFCKLLQKNKRYYYKPNHFVSVSSMAFRMNRNGAGLASICILATMVLVMISSTACLYFGEESAIDQRYPRDINIDFTIRELDGMSYENTAGLRGEIDAFTSEAGIEPQDVIFYRAASTAGLIEGNTVELDVSKVNSFSMDTYSNVYQFYFVPLSDYNDSTGGSETLNDGEVMISVYRGEYEEDTITFNGGGTFRIKKHADEYFDTGESAMQILPSIMIVVPDFENALADIADMVNYYGDSMLNYRLKYNFNTGLDGDGQIGFYKDLRERMRGADGAKNIEEKYNAFSYIESRELERQDFYGLFGALFYIGIILSIVFILAAVLIIYYKQVSEGYEDQSRFTIMQKVGMTKREIKKSINSQLLTVFFLPLVFAAMHLSFAFPIIRKLLLLFNLNNVPLFAATTGISILVFAVFYTIVYRLTAGAYYNIVSGAKEG